MINSITSYLFGATSDDYGKGVDSVHLTTTPAEDEWLLVETCSVDQAQVEIHPMENLLIEHPSMSVYQSSSVRSARGRPAASCKSQQMSNQFTAAPPRTVVRAAAVVCNRTEPYNLRKSTTMQRSHASRKQTSAKAFQHQNKVYNRKNYHVHSRPVVFQPRK